MTHLVVIGGFLGAGKTTAILAMAKHLLAQGQRVGIVTNDQGSDLVDTAFLASEGLPVLEVNGGCFCCNFDEFAAKVAELADSEMPDVVLAEPVGSCTDLVATIFKPLARNVTKSFALRPLSILADPKRVARLMKADEAQLFPDEINYLFQKQMEEADILLLNKCDALSEAEQTVLLDYLRARYLMADVLALSAKEGIGLSDWAARTASSPVQMRTIQNLDYDMYADAEAKLGWLNSTLLVRFLEDTDINAFGLAILRRISDALSVEHHEIAHLKLYAVDEGDWMKLSQTSLETEPAFNRQMRTPTCTVNLVINARANTSPQVLQDAVEDAVKCEMKQYGARYENWHTACFSPSRPNPTHRMA